MFDILEILPSCPPIRIIDVGAMFVGNEIYAPLMQAGIASVLGFECVEAECQKLNATSQGKHTYLPHAVGDGRERTFHECNFPMTSSLYEPNTELLAKFQNLENLTQVVRKSSLPTRRLDDMPEAAQADFIKLDVQGAEVDVMNGASKVLAEVVVLHTEVEFVPMYCGQPLFAEVDQRMRQAGFLFHKFAGIAGRTFQPLVVNNDVNHMLSQMLWADAVYVKDFMAFGQLPAEKLLKMAVILHVLYSSFDLTLQALLAYDAKTATNLVRSISIGSQIAVRPMATVTHQQAFEIALENHRAGRYVEAETIYQQLRAIYPQNPDLWHLLGVVAHQAGRLDEALGLIQQAIAANPGEFAYHNNLGLLLTKIGRREEAVSAFQNAIRLQPDFAEPYYNSGITLYEMGRAAESIAAYQKTLRLQPAHVSARLNLGLALSMGGRVEEALAHYRKILGEEPGNVSVAVNLANLLKDLSQLEQAIALYRTALRYSPQDVDALSNLGCALKDSAELDAALECYRAGLALNPNRPEIHSNLIFTSYFHPSIPQTRIVEDLRGWNTLHARPLREEWRLPRNDPSPDRRLRVGYVSPDFREHVVGRTLLPCFEAHDRTQFEFFCYSGVSVEDTVTARFRALSAGWCDTATLSETQLADRIRCDRIDILVDLALHTAFNRLLTFARKPAPVQIAWLGYPGTTGLEAMDYRITDFYLDPPGRDTAGSFEEPLRLPDAWCCYQPPEKSPAVSELPASSAGFVTFGSFNNFAKINERVLGLWARVMTSVPDSRLLLVLKGSRRDSARRFLEEHGISAERVEFLAYYPGLVLAGKSPPPAYLDRYHRIDMALDPFPYNGMTTTCDALWMGVPVVALIGEASLGRASFSLLSNVGLPELAAPSEYEYARIAVELAGDLPRLAGLRATLRSRMERSALLDAPRFARNLEAAFRQAWGIWCAQPTSAPPS